MTRLVGKRELNKERKRGEIVRVASDLFLNHGYGATSMSAIADKLGGSKTTLWTHFPSKEDVFAAVIDLHVEVFSKDVDRVLVGQAFSQANMKSICLRFIERLLDDRSILLYRLVTSEGARFPEIRQLFYQRGPLKMRARIIEFLSTSFDGDDARRLTQFIVPAVLGYRSEILTSPHVYTQVEHEAFVENLIVHIAWPPEKSPS